MPSPKTTIHVTTLTYSDQDRCVLVMRNKDEFFTFHSAPHGGIGYLKLSSLLVDHGWAKGTPFIRSGGKYIQRFPLDEFLQYQGIAFFDCDLDLHTKEELMACLIEKEKACQLITNRPIASCSIMLLKKRTCQASWSRDFSPS